MEARNDSEYYLQLLQKFSLITIGENKVPNFAWKDQQSTKLSESEFIKRLNYEGGIITKRGYETPGTKGVGIATGYDGLECIDIDTKVFFEDAIQKDKSLDQQTEEKDKFIQEYFQTLRDHIEDFDHKVVMYQTRSGGYHILYKAKNLQGNRKLAKLKGYTEAVLETRSNGGYIFIYKDNQVSERSYFDIGFITDEERDIIIQISQMYDYKDPLAVLPAMKKEKKNNQNVNHSEKNYAWSDYNDKTEVWDLIRDEFHIIQNRPDMVVVRRNGSKAQWSGYIYKDSGCLFLFSTGTRYPSETLLSPYHILAYKKYNGDLQETARKLYFEGYGDRLESDEDKPQKKQYKRKYFFSENIFKKTLSGYQENHFIKYLKELDLPEESINKSIEDYYLGTITKSELAGSVTFPLIDEFGRINGVLVSCESEYLWLHSILQERYQKDSLPEWLKVYLKNESFNNCLFGIHLMKQYSGAKIVVVERPEEAILGSILKPESLWLASGNIAEIQPENFRKLKNKDVIYLVESDNDLIQLQNILLETEIQESIKVKIHQVSGILDYLQEESVLPPVEMTEEKPSFSDQELQELAEKLIPEMDSRTETEMIMALKKEGIDLQDAKDVLIEMRMKNIIDITSLQNYFLFNSTPF